MSYEVDNLPEGRGLSFVVSTGYDATGVLPPNLAGNRMIAEPFNLEAVDAALMFAIIAHEWVN